MDSMPFFFAKVPATGTSEFQQVNKRIPVIKYVSKLFNPLSTPTKITSRIYGTRNVNSSPYNSQLITKFHDYIWALLTSPNITEITINTIMVF